MTSLTVFGRATWAILLGAILFVPVAGGVAATLLPAFGYLPALGRSTLSLDAWRDLLAWPGLGTSLILTVSTGLLATFLSLASAVAMAALARRAGWLRAIQAWLPAVLATPHSALAIGFAFLAAPSGWIARVISPWLTGWRSPPDFASVQDQWGVALVLGLWLKETPYLLLMLLAALGQAEAAPASRVAAALGYGPWRGWMLGVLPRVWRQMRLPVMAVLAFSLSVVDVALVLGPTNPPSLAVQVLRWFSDPDLARWFTASAGALLLAGVIGAAILGLLGVEVLAAWLGRMALRTGARGGAGAAADAIGGAVLVLWGSLSAAALAVLAVWSCARVWRFPAALPRVWDFAAWPASDLAGPAAATIGLGIAATAIALAIVIGCLASGVGRRGAALVYVPLLVPQVAFLFGMQVALLRLRLDGGAAAVVWAHLVFVLPYVFLALADPWRALDPRYGRSAACLGASPLRVLFRVTLPMLARPLLAASATGFAVSAGLYLPTLFAGAGRWRTLTTEAVTLASGGDRRVVAATALLQAAVPLLAFVLAVGLPGWRERRR